MEDFFPKENVPVVTKKRKTEKQPVDEEIRKKAQFYCTCPEQWRSVSRYSKERLEQFVQENEFKQQQSLHLQVFDFVQKGIAFVTDKLSNGGGYVEEQIARDTNLRTAIQAEAGNFVSLLNNKVKLFALMAADTATGKMNQRQNEPKIIEIKNDDSPIFFGQTPRQTETTMPSGGEIPRNTLCNEAFGDASSGPERNGEIPNDSLDVERSEGIEVDL